MLEREIYVAAAVLAGSVCARAQAIEPTAAVLPHLASIDADGHVKPIDRLARSFEIVGETDQSRVATSCPLSKPMPEAAAETLVVRVATQEGSDPILALAVAKIGSREMSTASARTSTHGLMQLTPEVAKRFKVDLCSPEANVRGGIRYLAILQKHYRSLFFVLAAYIAGEEAVDRAHGIPADLETVRFVADVVNDIATRSDAVGEIEPAQQHTGLNSRNPNPSDAQPPLTASDDKPTAPTDWSAGFVMHVQ